MNEPSDSQNSLAYTSNKEGSGGSSLESKSSSSVDKDELIDEMQIKFGELLDVHQQLGNTKRQVDSLKQQMATQQDAYEKKEKKLLNEIAKLRDELAHSQTMAGTLNDEIAGYREKIEERDQAYRKLKEDMTASEAKTRADLNNLLEKQKREFQNIIDKKDQDLNELHKQVIELRAENVTNNDSMLKKHIELEKLTVNKGKMETQLRRLENEKQEADERAASLRQIIHKMKDEHQALTDRITDNEQQIEKYKNEVHAQQNVIESQKDDIEELHEKLDMVQRIFPQLTDFNKLIEEIEDKIELADKLPIELKNTRKQLRRALKELGATQSETEKYGKEISQLREDSSLLQDTIDNLTEKNQTLVNKLQLLMNSQKNVKVIEAANREFSHRINTIHSALKGVPDVPPLRTIIISTLMLKRWKRLTGSSKKYEKDYRNWWWLVGSKNDKKEEPLQIIAELSAQKSKLTKKVEKLVTVLQDAEKYSKIQEQQIAEKENQLKIAKAKEEDLEENISALKIRIEKCIDDNEFSKLSEKYTQVKQSLKEVTAALETVKSQNMELKHENVMLKQKQEENLKLNTNIGKNSEALKLRLSEAEDEITLLRQALSSKNKEIATLERVTSKITSQQVTTSRSESYNVNNDNQKTEITYCSSISDNVNRPLTERLLAMSRLIN